MIVSLYGVAGRESPLQSKYGLVTTDSMVCPRLSVASCWSGWSNLCPKTACESSDIPKIALAYGSSRSLAGL